MTIPDEAVQAERVDELLRKESVCRTEFLMARNARSLAQVECSRTLDNLQNAKRELYEAGFTGSIMRDANGYRVNALTAALPFLTGVKVKALEWKEESGLSEFGSTFKATAGTIGYRIFQQSPKHTSRFIVTTLGVTSHPDNIVSEVNTLDAAKAAAQADYEARIMSAIEVAPSPRAQALEELLSDDMLKDISTEFISWRGENPYKVHRGGYAAWEVEKPALKAALSFAIRALSSQPVADGWSPIETAPKDPNTVILVLLPRMMNLIVRARYNSVHGYWITDCDNDGRISKPTFFHPGDMWHPMPALPASPGAPE